MSVKIIILNGVGSAGKSSIAKSLQTITEEPFLNVSMDKFMEMLPEDYQNHSDGFSFESVADQGKPMVIIKTGPVGKRLMKGMRHAIAALAGQGNNLIIDDVMLADEADEYANLLRDFDVYFVGVIAPLDVLEDRKRKRVDRLNGLARWQINRVHKDNVYDLEVDTSSASPMECAALIVTKFGF